MNLWKKTSLLFFSVWSTQKWCDDKWIHYKNLKEIKSFRQLENFFNITMEPTGEKTFFSVFGGIQNEFSIMIYWNLNQFFTRCITVSSCLVWITHWKRKSPRQGSRPVTMLTLFLQTIISSDRFFFKFLIALYSPDMLPSNSFLFC